MDLNLRAEPRRADDASFSCYHDRLATYPPRLRAHRFDDADKCGGFRFDAFGDDLTIGQRASSHLDQIASLRLTLYQCAGRHLHHKSTD